MTFPAELWLRALILATSPARSAYDGFCGFCGVRAVTLATSPAKLLYRRLWIQSSDIGNLASKASDKAGEATPDVDIPGFGTFKGNPKQDAQQAQNKASELTSSVDASPGFELANADKVPPIIA